MSPYSAKHLTDGISFPRVSGDEPGTLSGDGDTLEFSPRERG